MRRSHTTATPALVAKRSRTASSGTAVHATVIGALSAGAPAGAEAGFWASASSIRQVAAPLTHHAHTHQRALRLNRRLDGAEVAGGSTVGIARDRRGGEQGARRMEWSIVAQILAAVATAH